ncbi:MAG: hypothetical protein IKA10_05225 [Oscillospiraceae bacterium]|nr:hypothetical protein [Oscillospiraceae bacterium]
MQKGKIEKIKIFTEKGKPGKMVQSVDCLVDLGLSGDRFAKGGEKQLTIIDRDSENWICAQETQGLCFGRFKANITVEDMDLSVLKSGDKLFCGDAVLEISSEKKECFAECERVQNKMDCRLRNSAKYLKVHKSGRININDYITKNG